MAKNGSGKVDNYELAQSMVAAGFMFMSYENIFEIVNKIMTTKNLQKLK